MKYFSIAFIFLFLNSLSSQEYITLLSQQSKWSTTINYGMGSELTYSYFLSCDILSSDSIINNLAYKKIIKSGSGDLMGLIREDILERKVYQVPLGEEEEKIIFDFTLEAGDEVYFF